MLDLLRLKPVLGQRLNDQAWVATVTIFTEPIWRLRIYSAFVPLVNLPQSQHLLLLISVGVTLVGTSLNDQAKVLLRQLYFLFKLMLRLGKFHSVCTIRKDLEDPIKTVERLGNI